jgi:hypothetical protein
MKVLLVLLLAHSWYPTACCGGQDCRQIPCESISFDKLSNDYVYGGKHFATLSPSKDAECHACFRPGASVGICLFMPALG